MAAEKESQYNLVRPALGFPSFRSGVGGGDALCQPVTDSCFKPHFSPNGLYRPGEPASVLSGVASLLLICLEA
jgi:hypothetical protein